MNKLERILLFKRLGMSMRSGLPILESLRMIRAETQSKHVSHVLDSLIADVSGGRPLSQALARFERQIGAFCVQVIRIGESSGMLRENVEYLADELKRTQALKRRMVGALMYPAIIIAATLGIVGLLVAYIFPKILPVLSGVQGTLPFSTRVVITVSKFVTEYGVLAFAGLIAVVGAYLFARQFTRFLLATDGALVFVPVIGPVVRSYNVAMLSRTIALLMRGDMPVAEALELAAASTRNAAYRTHVSAAREVYMRGQKLSTYFTVHPRHFPILFTQMIAVGESTGSLADSFVYVSEMYEEDVNERTRDMTTLLEPILMGLMGLIVGFIAISIITPIYSITQSLGAHR